jgi:hypothetical protein
MESGGGTREASVFTERVTMKCAPLRRHGFFRRTARRGPGRTSLGACGPLNRLRIFASLDSGYPSGALGRDRASSQLQAFHHKAQERDTEYKH